ncbi:unnamed protein product [marine sediment metagenome]|uniref:Uncharacterized protein n=1 Tax=marine sediment metagenome TaxID=412755 RepID=X1BCV3_9ZZZZ
MKELILRILIVVAVVSGYIITKDMFYFWFMSLLLFINTIGFWASEKKASLLKDLLKLTESKLIKKEK